MDNEWVSHFVYLQFTNGRLLRRVGQPFCLLTIHKWPSTAQSGSAILFAYNSQIAVYCAEWVNYFVYFSSQMAVYYAEWVSHFVNLQLNAQSGSAILFDYSSQMAVY